MRILLADDHELLRDTLEMWFLQEKFEVECAHDLPSAMEKVASLRAFDILLLDYGMPGMDGLMGLKVALEDCKGAKVALISGVAPPDVAKQALEMGASGFLPKTMPAKSFVNAVRFMSMGETFAPVDFLTQEAEDESDSRLNDLLTNREMEVLLELSKGLANKEIARILDVREPTVKLHMKTLFRKIGVSNRTQAAMVAKEEGLL